MTSNNSIIRTKIGKVISVGMQKTIVVEITRTVKHKKYSKMIRRRTKLHAHDEAEVCKLGNIVKIRETKPFSKLKTWDFVEVIS